MDGSLPVTFHVMRGASHGRSSEDDGQRDAASEKAAPGRRSCASESSGAADPEDQAQAAHLYAATSETEKARCLAPAATGAGHVSR